MKKILIILLILSSSSLTSFAAWNLQMGECGVGGTGATCGQIAPYDATKIFAYKLGNTTGTSTATPLTLNLGGTYSSSHGANLKLLLHDSGASKYGIGVSAGQLDFSIPAGTSYHWYINGVDSFYIDSSGVLHGNGGSLTTTADNITNANTVGKALVKLANPSAITFLKINADNSVTARSAANFRTDLGLGTGDSPLFSNVNVASGNSFTTTGTTFSIGIGASNITFGTSARMILTAETGAGGGWSALLSTSGLSTNRNFDFPNRAGTFALNPMTTLGDLMYGGSSGAETRLAANATATRKFLLSVSGLAPSYDTVTAADVGLSTTADAQFQSLVLSGSSSNETLLLGKTVTGSDSFATLNMSTTWNTSGTPTLIQANVIDTASNAASLLMNLKVGGSTKFKVGKDGKITLANGSTLVDSTSLVTTLQTPQGITGHTSGGDINLLTGTGKASGGDGGQIVLQTAAGLSSGNGGAIDLIAGDAAGGSNFGGNILIQTGSGSTPGTNNGTIRLNGATWISKHTSILPPTDFDDRDGDLHVDGNSYVEGMFTIYAGTPAASRSEFNMTGTPYTAGTATTNKPLALIENASTSTGWSTSGTFLGINGASSFTGNLLDLQLNGVSKFKVAYDGTTTIAGKSIALGPLSGPVTFTGPTAARTITIPDANWTAARTDAAQTFSGVQTFTSPVIGGHATIEGVTPTGSTGTGNLVFSASPTFSGTATIANLTASQASVTFSGNDYALKIGSLQFQNYGLNNIWFGDNVNFNGSNFVYVATGTASFLRFFSGEISLRSYASGTGGTNLANNGNNIQLKVTPAGDVALGGVIDQTAGSFTGAKMVIFNSGGASLGSTTDPSANNLNVQGVFKVNGTQVLGARVTGYTAMTGTGDKATSWDVSTITLAQLAARMKQLQADLTTHGLIGP